MDKLLNISREGGFPLCAETLQVIYDNARAVNVLLTGLNLPNKSAVILGTEDFSTAVTGYRYMFAVNNNKRRLVRYTMGSGVDLSSAKVTITEELHDVTDSNLQTISSVYAYERAVIESTSDANEKWKFYNLKDVLEVALWENLLPLFLERINLCYPDYLSLSETYNNILCKNEFKLRLKLKIDIPVAQGNRALEDFHIPFSVGINGIYPLNAILVIGSIDFNSVDAFIANHVIYVKCTGYTVPQLHPAYVLINSEIIL